MENNASIAPQAVRLKPDEIKKIKDAVYEYDKDAGIYTFGSRADLNKKGGDLDILVTEVINSPFLEMAIRTGVRL